MKNKNKPFSNPETNPKYTTIQETFMLEKLPHMGQEK